VPEQSAALAVATLRSMLRAPEVKMQWGSSFVVMLVVGGSMLFRGASGISETFRPFVVTGVMAFSLFFMIQNLANQFGFDRDGFRALVLSPADRKLILIGKNLACLPAPATISIVMITAVSVALHVSPAVYVAGLLQLLAGLLVMGMAGNVISILMPYRIQPGTMKPTKMPGLAILMLVLVQMLFPIVMAPLFIAPLAGLLWHRAGGPPAGAIDLVISLILAAIVVVAYWMTIAPLGRLLQRRETKILATVTVENE
jgi:ABC-2 type transport system permease protein